METVLISKECGSKMAFELPAMAPFMVTIDERARVEYRRAQHRLSGGDYPKVCRSLYFSLSLKDLILSQPSVGRAIVVSEIGLTF